MSNVAKNFLLSITAHKEQRRKLIKNTNLKRELLTVPPRQGCQNLIELEAAHRKNRISGIQNRSASAQCYRYSECYVGHDP